MINSDTLLPTKTYILKHENSKLTVADIYLPHIIFFSGITFTTWFEYLQRVWNM